MFAELLLVVGWVLGPRDALLAQQIATAEATVALPLTALQPISEQLWVVWHQRQDWTRAFYLPPETPVTQLVADAGPSAEVLLPGLRLPRLFLYAPDYQKREIWGSLAVDTAEIYFHALLEAYFDQELRRSASRWRPLVEKRAPELLPDLPPDVQTTAYLAGLIDFAAHTLATAHEIQRTFKRRPSAAERCALLQRPGLPTLWQKIFTAEQYRGSYPTGNPAQPWQLSPRGITAEDKALVQERLFAHRFSGDPQQDWGHFCH